MDYANKLKLFVMKELDIQDGELLGASKNPEFAQMQGAEKISGHPHSGCPLIWIFRGALLSFRPLAVMLSTRYLYS